MTTETEPQTLIAAHEVVQRRRPASDAKLSSWLAFHQGNERIYKMVADVDRGHHHEALYWADYERRKAGEVSAWLQSQR
ncbi:AMED_5909 family protein [Amycolatopsis sp. NPDC059027]|uniref:AMED_5909 family protein n=1 Tax=Amycolatopsis sp. NPDC059027 TaxID=3346709 RepID=UPI00366A9C38